MNAPVNRNIHLQMPEAFRFLLGRERYVVAWGGRGSGKSINIGRTLLIRGMEEKHRILCVRELQGSIKESVHQLLKDEIAALGLGWFYQVFATTIRGLNGTEFIFKGLRFNANEIKSMQGVTLVWCEEARVISKNSWDVLIPTIRTAGSQFFISFNAELEDDDTYQRFVVNPPKSAVVRKVGWQDNPFFPDVLRIEMEHLRDKSHDDYLNVWEGHCRVALEGAVYVNELRDAQSEGRICKVPIERGKPVHTFWDLGRADSTAIWFAQLVGLQVHIVASYDANGFGLDHFMGELARLEKEHRWFYGTHWLPHDADNRLLGSRRTIRQQMEDAGHKVRIVPRLPIAEGINAFRTMFPRCYFDMERAKPGIDALRQYHYEVSDSGTRSNNPKHDQSSHYADAARYLGVALKEDNPKPKVKPKLRASLPAGRNSWMAR